MSTTTRHHPILFLGPMILAILDGRKMQTRRIMKPQPPIEWEPEEYGMLQPMHNGEPMEPSDRDRWGVFGSDMGWFSPYGQPGDRLIVKEAHRWLQPDKDSLIVRYEADGQERAWRFDELSDNIVAKAKAYTRWGGLRPGRFLHHAFSRITPEIVGLQVERLESITEADAIAEGFESRESFLHTIYEINHRAVKGSDPWVWVVEFQNPHGRQPACTEHTGIFGQPVKESELPICDETHDAQSPMPKSK